MIKVKKLCDSEELVLPEYKTLGSAGFDLRVFEPYSVQYLIEPQEIVCVGTSLAFDIPDGYEVQIRSRSGMALKGLIVHNAPGTIDSDYKQEIKIILRNTNMKDSILIQRGDRIAQGILAKVARAEFEQVDQLSPEQERTGGFGSTGVK